MTDTLAAKPTAAAPPTVLVPKGTHLGPVHLAVTDPGRALSVWRDMVGLTSLELRISPDLHLLDGGVFLREPLCLLLVERTT